MLNSVKSEIYKLLTVRSTYVITILSLIITGFVGYSIGNNVNKVGSEGMSADFLTQNLYQVITVLAILPAIVALLLFAHEYRYNTIMYTLTSAGRRFKVLLGKLAAATIYTAFMSLALLVVAALFINGAINGGVVGQDFNFLSVLAHSFFYVWTYAFYAMVIVIFVRNQAGAIAGFILGPFVLENLLTLILKGNSQYLPFQSLTQFFAPDAPASKIITPLAYVVGLSIAAYIFFARRDAN